MGKLFTLSKNPNKKAFQRAALFFIIVVLTLGVIEPAATFILPRSDGQNILETFKIDPLSSEEIGSTEALTEYSGGPLELPEVENPQGKKSEIVSERTTHGSVYVNNDGTKTLEVSMKQQNYKDGDEWKKIDNSITAVQEDAPDPSLWQRMTNTEPEAPLPSEYTSEAGSIDVSMKSLSQGVALSTKEKTFTMKPIGANDVKPQKKNDQTIVYKDAWKGVDIEYETIGEVVKENIVLNNKDAKNEYEFKISGAKLIDDPDDPNYFAIEGAPEYRFGDLTLSLNDRGPIESTPLSQVRTDDNSIKITIDKDWLRSLPSSSFPLIIDPSFGRWDEGSNTWVIKSNGYMCNGYVCWLNAGTLNDGGWKHWRTYVKFPYPELAGKKVLGANVHAYYYPYANPDPNPRYLFFGHANCIGWECRGTHLSTVLTAGDFDVDVTDRLQAAVNSGDMGVVWSFWGEEVPYKTFKTYSDMYLGVVYDTPTPMASPTAPADKQVTIDTQPSLNVNAVGDADGDAVQYYFRVSTKPDAETGAVINSGWINSPQWTIPEGILQDGTTYYWHTYTKGATQTNPNWVRSFKVDLRTGKDSTQSYETIGPVGVDLATGNATLTADTHSMKALGGDMGMSLTYNTPNKAKKGLKGEYWNVGANYNFSKGAPTSSPKVTRRDTSINFNWSTGAPAGGVSADWFYVRWSGQFVAPVDGAYKFGGSNDDNMKITVNGQEQYNQGCYDRICFNEAKSITLSAGEVVPIQVEYIDATGLAYAKLYVKGPVSQQVVPQAWLHTNVANEPQSFGLTGRYYTNTGDRNIDNAAKDPERLMMVRRDTNLNLNFGTGGPAQGMQADNFMARWTGYITVPTSGSYRLGANGDDGMRIKVKTGSSWTTLLDSWSHTGSNDRWGNSVNLTANVAVPIMVDFIEDGGLASIALRVQDTTGTQMNMPTSWLTPNANSLPEQWSLGVDINGDVAYERLRVSNNAVILEDSTGSTHEYTYTNGGYKPPVNEDGSLSKNANNTYTFIDTDGRTYIFDAEGKLTSLTSPTDDRQPASLKYTYAGDPSRLIKIEDGVTSERYATVYYKGVNDSDDVCSPNNASSSFFGLFSQFDQAPNGMLCGFETSDGDVTSFYYKGGNLARIVEPGNEITDYGYDSFGRIVSIRDSLASDVIGAGVREDNDSVTTQLSYDSLGRIASVKAPAPTEGAKRQEHTLAYKPNVTDMHVVDTTEPNGYSRRVQYDSLLRTTSDTDVSGKVTHTEWDSVKDLQLSTTDTTGLKSTTIYDADDRITDNYGPAPAAWYDGARKPLPAYVDSVPRTSSAYDEGMKGPAVTWYNLKSNNMAFVGAPKAYTTGFSSGNSPEQNNSAYLRHNFNGQALPIEASVGDAVPVYRLSGHGDRLWTISTAEAQNVQRSGWAYNTVSFYAHKDNIAGTTPIYRLVNPSNGDRLWTASKSEMQSVQSGGWRSEGVGFYAYNSPVNGASPIYRLYHSGSHRHFWTESQADIQSLVNNNGWKNEGVVFYAKTGTTVSEGYGFIATGKLRFPQSGTYTFSAASDDSVKLLIDDQQIFSNWGTRTLGANQNTLAGTFNATAGKVYRFTYQYGHEDVTNLGNSELFLSGPGVSKTSDWSPYLQPGYNLETSQTAYDNQLGNVTTTTTYSKPEYGLVDKTTLDPAGLNLQSTATYEAPGTAGGFLRQTSKTLPGGGTTTYHHYGANDTRDNPCTAEVESYHQAGRPKGKTEADPDGDGPQTSRTSETIYNESGEVVATRYNDDPWTCTEYDSRGRILKTITPSVGDNPGRTVANDYAKDGNPLVTTTSDNQGTIRVENDLLGRTVKYTDTNGKETVNNYDDHSKLTKRESSIGIETYEYDAFDRLIVQKLDGVTFATVTYDQYSRLATVQYPSGVSLSNISRDVLGREDGTTFTVNGQTYSDSIERYVSGDIKQGEENGVVKQYTYDNAGRLTGATIGDNTFTYEFGASDVSCDAVPGNNTNAGKNGNRTKMTMNGQATTYCYDMADRLVSSSDPTLTDVQYDSHGNTISLGASDSKTEFSYDVNDRNIGIKSGNSETTYTRDAQDRIVGREHKENGATTSYVAYGFTGSGDTPDYLLDGNGDAQQKYLMLPGDVLVTIKPNVQSAGATTFSLPNIHGDIYLTVDADGSVKSAHQTGPFGEELPNQINPLNTADGTSWNYVGQHQKLTETETGPISGGIIQMGARVYIPVLGRFLQVDPVEGAGDTAYTYVNDPINDEDLDGQIAPIVAFAAWQLGRIAVQQTIKIAAKHVAKQAVQQVVKKAPAQAVKKTVQKALPKKTANYSVYLGRSKTDKAIKYVGITKRNPNTRFAEHLRSKTPRANLDYRVKASNLTKMQARRMEQSIINKYGLRKNGGQLYNKINSIRRR